MQIQFTEEQLNIVLNALGQLPYVQAQPVIQEIISQVQVQQEPKLKEVKKEVN